MSTSAIVLIIIGAVIALIIILALVIGKDMAIEETTIIKKPKQQVFDYLKFLKNHDNFSVWNQMDPEMTKEYKGTDGQVGFMFAWESLKDKNVGKGEQTIAEIKEGELIACDLHFIKPWESNSKAKFKTESVSANETKVTWGFYTQMPYPMNIMKNMFKKVLAKDLVKGLANLKEVMEK